MKLKLNLDNGTIEYLDKVAFIQGQSDTQNKIELYCPLNTVTNVKVAYTMADGKSTIALSNNGSSTEPYDGTDFQKITFNLPIQTTTAPGQIMVTFIITTANGVTKFNVMNNIIKSSEFESLMNTAEDADESGLISDVDALSQSVGILQNHDSDHEVRINYLESVAVDEHNYASTKLNLLPNVEDLTPNDRLYVYTNFENEAQKLTVRQLQDRIIRTASEVPSDLEVGQYLFLEVEEEGGQNNGD